MYWRLEFLSENVWCCLSCFVIYIGCIQTHLKWSDYFTHCNSHSDHGYDTGISLEPNQGTSNSTGVTVSTDLTAFEHLIPDLCQATSILVVFISWDTKWRHPTRNEQASILHSCCYCSHQIWKQYLATSCAIMAVSPIVIQVEEGGASFIQPTYIGNALVCVNPKRSSADACIFLSVWNTTIEKVTCTDISGNCARD